MLFSRFFPPKNLLPHTQLAFVVYILARPCGPSANLKPQTSFMVAVDNQKSSLTIDDFVSGIGLGGVTLSRDGILVAYHAGPKYRIGPSATSQLWIAETSVEESTRQVTFGSFHDHSPQFPGPRSDVLYFLSDRSAPGKASDIYRIAVSAALQQSENVAPIAVTPIDSERKVAEFSVSPDGQFLAFLSTEMDKADQTGMPVIWNGKKGLNRLFLLNLTDSSARFSSFFCYSMR